MHISYKPLWHTLVERDMRKEDLRLAAGLTTNMIANMGKEGKNISMDTLVRICETLDCGILDVIELASDEPSVTEKRKNNRKNNKNRMKHKLVGSYYAFYLKLLEKQPAEKRLVFSILFYVPILPVSWQRLFPAGWEVYFPTALSVP